jgi:hypothetical protein
MKKQISVVAALIIGLSSVKSIASPGTPVSKLEALKAIADPYFRKAGDKVFLNFLNLDRASVVVKVVDGEGRLLFFERYTDTPVVEKAFNFEKAEEGIYKLQVVVSEGDSTYSESFKIVK